MAIFFLQTRKPLLSPCSAANIEILQDETYHELTVIHECSIQALTLSCTRQSSRLQWWHSTQDASTHRVALPREAALEQEQQGVG